MEHLTSFDTVFLDAEDSDRHVSLAVGAMAVIEGPMPDYQAVEAAIGERIPAVPRLRQVLRTHLLDLSAPGWADDPNFDLGHHLHRAALPHPGGDAELYTFAAEVMERRLDRDRPLWECWIIDGLSEGRWALLMKLHHCIADGISAMHIFAALSDDGEGKTFATQIRAAHTHPGARGGSSPLGLDPIRWTKRAWRMAGGAASATVQAIGGAVEIARSVVTPGGGSALTGPVTAMRRFSAAHVSLREVDEICREYAVTLNDVALAAVTYSYRSVLINQGQLPRRRSLRTLVPVSVRGLDAAPGGNRVSLMLPFLPVEEDDPAEQLRAVRKQMNRLKGSGQREAGGIFVAAANAMPFPVTALVARILTRLPQTGVVALVTNVPGPRHHLRLSGREVLSVLPIPPIALGLRTGIAVLSYGDDLVFGITGDYDTSLDVDALARGIERAIPRLIARSRGSAYGLPEQGA